MENHNWYAVLTAPVLLSKELTDKQKLFIALVGNLSNQKGYCFASNKYMGECLGCSERYVQQMISELEDKKIIGRALKLNEKNEVEYRAILLTLDNLTPPEPQFTPSRTTVHHNNNIDIDIDLSLFNMPNKQINNIRTREEKLKKDFERFWIEYDKKVDKESAWKKFKKLKDPEIEKVFEVIPKYKKHQPDKQYRKHPTTWLNNRSWENEYETSESENKTHEPSTLFY